MQTPAMTTNTRTAAPVALQVFLLAASTLFTHAASRWTDWSGWQVVYGDEHNRGGNIAVCYRSEPFDDNRREYQFRCRNTFPEKALFSIQTTKTEKSGRAVKDGWGENLAAESESKNNFYWVLSGNPPTGFKL